MHRAPVHERECEFMRHHLFLRERRWFVWHGILFEEPNPTGSRPSDLIGLYRQQKKPHPPNTQGRARRKHGGEQGHPEEAESHPEEAERRRRKGIETAEGRRRETAGAPLRRGQP